MIKIKMFFTTTELAFRQMKLLIKSAIIAFKIWDKPLSSCPDLTRKIRNLVKEAIDVTNELWDLFIEAGNSYAVEKERQVWLILMDILFRASSALPND